MGVDCCRGAFVCFGRALAVGCFVGVCGLVGAGLFSACFGRLVGDWFWRWFVAGRLAVVAGVIVGRFWLWRAGCFLIGCWRGEFCFYRSWGLGNWLAFSCCFGRGVFGGWREDILWRSRLDGFVCARGNWRGDCLLLVVGVVVFWGAWIVWRVVFVVWFVTGFGGWLVRG